MLGRRSKLSTTAGLCDGPMQVPLHTLRLRSMFTRFFSRNAFVMSSEAASTMSIHSSILTCNTYVFHKVLGNGRKVHKKTRVTRQSKGGRRCRIPPAESRREFEDRLHRRQIAACMLEATPSRPSKFRAFRLAGGDRVGGGGRRCGRESFFALLSLDLVSKINGIMYTVILFKRTETSTSQSTKGRADFNLKLINYSNSTRRNFS